MIRILSQGVLMDKIRSLTGMPDYSEKSEKDNVAAKLFHVENSLKEI